MNENWRSSRLKRLEAAAISIVGYRLVAALGATFRWRTDGLEHLEAVVRSGRQPIMAFWHGRILPATVFFRRRGIVVITSENFDGEWIAGIIERFGYGTARGSTSRGGRKALLQLVARHGGGKASRVHRRRPARSRARRTGRRRLAGENHRQSGAAVSHRSRPPLDDEQLGPHADPQAVRDASRSRWANRCDVPTDAKDVELEAARLRTGVAPARARNARAAVGLTILSGRVWGLGIVEPGPRVGEPRETHKLA